MIVEDAAELQDENGEWSLGGLLCYLLEVKVSEVLVPEGWGGEGVSDFPGSLLGVEEENQMVHLINWATFTIEAQSLRGYWASGIL